LQTLSHLSVQSQTGTHYEGEKEKRLGKKKKENKNSNKLSAAMELNK
jgi:hypothetical protein